MTRERRVALAASLLGGVLVCATARAQAAPPVDEGSLPGRVVFVGDGFELDESLCAELSAGHAGEERVLVTVEDASRLAPPTSHTTPTSPTTPDPLKRCGATVFRARLVSEAQFAGDERALAEHVAGAASITLSGGTYLDWYRLLTPAGHLSRLARSIQDAHRAGVVVVGVGAAGPMLAQWAMVDRAALQRVQRNPRDETLDTLVGGLGLVKELAVDASACVRGSAARLVRASFDARLSFSVYLDGPVAWIADPHARTALVAGSGAALVFDLSSARHQRDALRAGRLSLLHDGDAWDGRARSLVGPAVLASVITAATGPEHPVDEALDAGVIESALASGFGPDAANGALLASPATQLRMWADERSRFSKAAAGRPRSPAAIAFDLDWRRP